MLSSCLFWYWLMLSSSASNLIMRLRCTRCIFPHSSSSCLILKSPPVIPYSAQHCGSFSLFLLLLQQKCSRGYSEPLKAGPGSVINTQTHAHGLHCFISMLGCSWSKKAVNIPEWGEFKNTPVKQYSQSRLEMISFCILSFFLSDFMFCHCWKEEVAAPRCFS